MLGFTQNDLVFNRVLNFNISVAEPVVVPEGKAWKIEYGITSASLKITTTNQPYGNDLNSVNSNPFNTQSNNSPMWLGAGCTISVSTDNPNMISILEFNVVAASSSSSGSGVGVSSAGFSASGIINLEFSATNTSNIGALVDLGNITVPEGKIWKIAATNFSSGTDPNTQLGSGYSGTVFVDGFYSSSSSPVYLSAGTYEVTGKTNASGGGSATYYIVAKINGIEYNAN